MEESPRYRPDAAASDETSGETSHETPGEVSDAETSDAASAAGTSVRPVDLRDYVSFAEGAATRVRVFATPRLAVDVWGIEPQQSTPVLHHAHEETTYTVIGGRSWFVTDEGEIGLDPMGALLVPPGVVHGIDNRAADPLIIVAVSAPPSAAPEDAPVTPEAAAVRRPRRPSLLRRAANRLLGS